MKKALLCVSFGTSVERAMESIAAVEAALAAAAPAYLPARAFTSSMIRRILAGRGTAVPDVTKALEQLYAQGVTEVLVQPTHILFGNEYDKIRSEMEPWRDRFQRMTLGLPLLADTEDLKNLAQVLSEAYPPRAGERLVLFGHGTDHAANVMYPALQTVFHLLGRRDVLIGTVEGWPAFEEAAAQLEQGPERSVHLVPLMLVAGDHAMNDMAGDRDSWRSRLEAAGYQVRCTVRGLGQEAGVRELYRRHLERML